MESVVSDASVADWPVGLVMSGVSVKVAASVRPALLCAVTVFAPEAEVEAVTELARSEITPISDVRGSSDYRFVLAENILRKFYCDATGVETYERVTEVH